MKVLFKMQTLGFALLFSMATFLANAQNEGLGSWSVFNVKYNFSPKWSVFGELQARSEKPFHHFFYHEYKGGATYKHNEQWNITLGTGSYQTYTLGGDFLLPRKQNEFRLFPQLIFSQNVGPFKIEQRYRTELRFFETGYRNRFRYRLGATYQFGEKKQDYKPYQILASNELFFGDTQPYFERNRLLLVVGYKPNRVSTIQLGYIYQYDYKIDNPLARDFLKVGYYLEFTKSNSKPIPSNPELIDD